MDWVVIRGGAGVYDQQRGDQAEADAVPEIERAIREAVKAGACWHALRIGHRPGAPWRQIGEARSRRAAASLIDLGGG